MKKINFLVTDTFYHQVKQVMDQLGVMNQSEFFRMAALQYINDRLAPKNHTESRQAAAPLSSSIEDLTHDEKIVLFHLQKGPMSADDLVNHTGFPIPKVLGLLTSLNLKKCVLQVGDSWRVL